MFHRKYYTRCFAYIFSHELFNVEIFNEAIVNDARADHRTERKGNIHSMDDQFCE